jgi:hypothetical protein
MPADAGGRRVGWAGPLSWNGGALRRTSADLGGRPLRASEGATDQEVAGSSPAERALLISSFA